MNLAVSISVNSSVFYEANHYPAADPRTVLNNFCEKYFYQKADYRTVKTGPLHNPTYSTTVYSKRKQSELGRNVLTEP